MVIRARSSGHGTTFSSTTRLRPSGWRRRVRVRAAYKRVWGTAFERGSFASGENTGRTWRACRFGWGRPSHTDGDHVLGVAGRPRTFRFGTLFRGRVRRLTAVTACSICRYGRGPTNGSGVQEKFGRHSGPTTTFVVPEPPRLGKIWKTVDFKRETQNTCLKQRIRASIYKNRYVIKTGVNDLPRESSFYRGRYWFSLRRLLTFTN